VAIAIFRDRAEREVRFLIDVDEVVQLVIGEALLRDEKPRVA